MNIFNERLQRVKHSFFMAITQRIDAVPLNNSLVFSLNQNPRVASQIPFADNAPVFQEAQHKLRRVNSRVLRLPVESAWQNDPDEKPSLQLDTDSQTLGLASGDPYSDLAQALAQGLSQTPPLSKLMESQVKFPEAEIAIENPQILDKIEEGKVAVSHESSLLSEKRSTTFAEALAFIQSNQAVSDQKRTESNFGNLEQNKDEPSFISAEDKLEITYDSDIDKFSGLAPEVFENPKENIDVVLSSTTEEIPLSVQASSKEKITSIEDTALFIENQVITFPLGVKAELEIPKNNSFYGDSDGNFSSNPVKHESLPKKEIENMEIHHSSDGQVQTMVSESNLEQPKNFNESLEQRNLATIEGSFVTNSDNSDAIGTQRTLEQSEQQELAELLKERNNGQPVRLPRRPRPQIAAPIVPITEDKSPTFEIPTEVSQNFLARLNRFAEIEKQGATEEVPLTYDKLEHWENHKPEENIESEYLQSLLGSVDTKDNLADIATSSVQLPEGNLVTREVAPETAQLSQAKTRTARVKMKKPPLVASTDEAMEKSKKKDDDSQIREDHDVLSIHEKSAIDDRILMWSLNGNGDLNKKNFKILVNTDNEEMRLESTDQANNLRKNILLDARQLWNINIESELPKNNQATSLRLIENVTNLEQASAAIKFIQLKQLSPREDDNFSEDRERESLTNITRNLSKNSEFVYIDEVQIPHAENPVSVLSHAEEARHLSLPARIKERVLDISAHESPNIPLPIPSPRAMPTFPKFDQKISRGAEESFSKENGEEIVSGDSMQVSLSFAHEDDSFRGDQKREILADTIKNLLSNSETAYIGEAQLAQVENPISVLSHAEEARHLILPARIKEKVLDTSAHESPNTSLPIPTPRVMPAFPRFDSHREEGQISDKVSGNNQFNQSFLPEYHNPLQINQESLLFDNEEGQILHLWEQIPALPLTAISEFPQDFPLDFNTKNTINTELVSSNSPHVNNSSREMLDYQLHLLNLSSQKVYNDDFVLLESSEANAYNFFPHNLLSTPAKELLIDNIHIQDNILMGYDETTQFIGIELENRILESELRRTPDFSYSIEPLIPEKMHNKWRYTPENSYNNSENSLNLFATSIEGDLNPQFTLDHLADVSSGTVSRDQHSQPLSIAAQNALQDTLGTSIRDIRVVRTPAIQPLLDTAQADALTIGSTVLLPAHINIDTPQGHALAAHEFTHAIRHNQPYFVPQVLKRLQGASINFQAEEEVARMTEQASYITEQYLPRSSTPTESRIWGIDKDSIPVRRSRGRVDNLPKHAKDSENVKLPFLAPLVPNSVLPAHIHAADISRPLPRNSSPAELTPVDQDANKQTAVGHKASVSSKTQIDIDSISREIYRRLQERLRDEIYRLN